MNILHRLFNGRVVKPRQTAAEQDAGNAPRFSPRSATRSRETGNTNLRAGSGSLAPYAAQSYPTRPRQESPDRAAIIPEVRIKQEDEEYGPLPMAPSQYEDPDFPACPSRMDGVDEEMDLEYALNDPESPEIAVKEERDEQDDSMFKSGFNNTYDSEKPVPSIEYDEYYEYGDDEGDERQDEETEEYDGQGEDDEDDSQEVDEEADSQGENEGDNEDKDEEEKDENKDEADGSEDEPEESDQQDSGEEEEPYVPRAKTPIFLHGMAQRPVSAPENEAGEAVNNEGLEIEDDAFEEELQGEMEPGLLIDDKDLRYWLHHKRATAGIETWPTEAIRLYKLLFLRGSFPMFHSTWIRDFSQEPVPFSLFTTFASDHLRLLQPEDEEHKASTALRKLFVVHIRVGSLVQQGDSYSINKIAPIIKRELELYVRWAENDIGFRKKRDYISPIFIIAHKTSQAASASRPIGEQCQMLVDKYKAWFARRDVQKYPRCIYIFVIVQHIVLVMVADTEKTEGEEPYPLAELDLSQRSHWLDYSLAISITIIMAKGALAAHRESCPEIEWETDDPDL